jgi:drug/metabolite transporter (DMT)-like permease
MPDRALVLRGALFILASEFMFASMGAAAKAASTGLPNEMIVFGRNAFGLLVILPLLLRMGPGYFRTEVMHLHLLRAAAGTAGMYCLFYAIAHLSLANGMLLKMTAPIFMPLIAWLWLREVAAPLAILAVPVGLAGVAVVLQPDAGNIDAAALIGVLGGALAALAKVTVRRLTRSEPATRVVFYFSVLATLVATVPLTWAWVTPTPTQWALLGALGFCGTVGQWLLTRGYACAPAARIGPFTYVSVVFAAMYGYLIWGETLDLAFAFGALLIAASGLLALYAKNRAVSSPAPMPPDSAARN